MCPYLHPLPSPPSLGPVGVCSYGIKEGDILSFLLYFRYPLPCKSVGSKYEYDQGLSRHKRAMPKQKKGARGSRCCCFLDVLVPVKFFLSFDGKIWSSFCFNPKTYKLDLHTPVFVFKNCPFRFFPFHLDQTSNYPK